MSDRPTIEQKIGIGALLALIIVFYFWTATTTAPPNIPTFSRQTGYHGLLANAFLAGQISLLIQPRPELLALSDPYDPSRNFPYRLHDASLYRGKYYIYFGPSPALFFFAPFRWLTGRDLPQFLAVALFCSIGLLFSVLVVHFLVSKYFTDTPYWFFVACVPALGFGSVAPYLLRRPETYEAAIASGYAFVSAAIFFMLIGAVAERISLAKIAAGSLLLGIAAGARFPTVAASVFPITLTGYLWMTGRAGSVRSRIRLCAAFFGPLAACLFLLGLYNYLRFDSWTDFGLKHALTGSINQSKYTLFNLERIPYGLRYYLFVPPRFVAQFPFVKVDPWFYLAPPSGYYLEPIVGLITITPVLAVLFIAPLSVRTLWRTHRELLLICVTFVVVGAALLGLVCSLSGTMRYEVDFASFFVVPALVVWRWYLEVSRNKRVRPLLLIPALLLFSAGTVVLNAAISITGYTDLLKKTRPVTYEAIHKHFRPVEQRFGFIEDPTISSPAQGTTLADSEVTFRWMPVTGAVDYWVDVGTLPGQGNIFSGLTHGETSVPVYLDAYLTGQTIHVQLFSKQPDKPLVPGTGNQFEYPTVLKYRRAGDLDGDGVPELITADETTRATSVLFMGGPGGSAVQSVKNLNGSMRGWRIAGIADFNGDGKPDILWQSDGTGAPQIWYMTGRDGITVQSTRSVDRQPPPGWKVVAIADLNGDGKPDIVWQEDVTRMVGIWYMGGPDGNIFQSAKNLTGPVPKATVVGPK